MQHTRFHLLAAGALSLLAGCVAAPPATDAFRSPAAMAVHDLAAALAGRNLENLDAARYDVDALDAYLGLICEVCFHETKAGMRKLLADRSRCFGRYPFVYEILRGEDLAALEWRDLQRLLPLDSNPRADLIMNHFLRAKSAGDRTPPAQ